MHLAEIYRRYGWLAVGKSFVYKALQRAIVLDISQLTILDFAELPDTVDSPFEFRPLEFHELMEFAKNPDLELSEAEANRAKGDLDFCFGALLDGELVGYTWLALDSIEAEHNRGGHLASGVAMSYPSNMMFMYKAFVRRESRGAGLYQQLVFAGGRWAHRDLGIQFQISTSDWTNIPALRSCQRQGAKVLGLTFRFGLENRMYTIGPKAADRLGVSVGGTAKVTVRRQDSEVHRTWQHAVLQNA